MDSYGVQLHACLMRGIFRSCHGEDGRVAARDELAKAGIACPQDFEGAYTRATMHYPFVQWEKSLPKDAALSRYIEKTIR
jgi:hypothetical protein